MADPRDTARTWLADVIHRATCHGRYDGHECAAPHLPRDRDSAAADAILSAPGVQVEEDRVRRFPQEVGDDEPMEVRNPLHMRVTHTQAVIRLPAQPIGDGHADV